MSTRQVGTRGDGAWYRRMREIWPSVSTYGNEARQVRGSAKSPSIGILHSLSSYSVWFCERLVDCDNRPVTHKTTLNRSTSSALYLWTGFLLNHAPSILRDHTSKLMVIFHAFSDTMLRHHACPPVVWTYLKTPVLPSPWGEAEQNLYFVVNTGEIITGY